MVKQEMPQLDARSGFFGSASGSASSSSGYAADAPAEPKPMGHWAFKKQLKAQFGAAESSV